MPPLGNIAAAYLKGLFDKFGLSIAAVPFKLLDTVQPVAVVDVGEPYYLDPPSIVQGTIAPLDGDTLVSFTAPKAGVYEVKLQVMTRGETATNADYAIRLNQSLTGIVIWQFNVIAQAFGTFITAQPFKLFMPQGGTLFLIKVGNATALSVYNCIIMPQSFYGK